MVDVSPARSAGNLSSSEATKSSDYIITAAQTYISRSANILGAQYLISNGKSLIRANTTIHCEYGSSIHLGRYCFIDEGVVLMPTLVPISRNPLLTIDRSFEYHSGVSGGCRPPGENDKALPLIIGSHTHIASNTHIQSIFIGSNVKIGNNCILMPRTKVYDNCIIEDDTILPADLVVPPYSRVRGKPGKIVGILPECWGGECVEESVREYHNFVKSLEIG